MLPDIVYQHKAWVVLNKPAGFSVQQLSEFYQNHFSAFHPVHRLDKETSGLWLIALDAKSNSELSQAFERKDIKKSYLAVISNKPKKKQGNIRGDMQRSRRGQWQLLSTRNNPAITQFKSVSLLPGSRLCLCQPVTGKTHQIRVAMKANGAAVLGDSYYAKEQSSQYDRLYLHAFRLAFRFDDQDYSFELLPESGVLFTSKAFLGALDQLTH